jgi:hypothetical protein
MTALPFVDEHGLRVRADEDETWPAVVGYATALSRTGHWVLSRLLGTVPESGFTIVETRPHRELTLAGRHRFATYRLVFRVAPDGPGARVTADTFARFPGLGGWVYRVLLLRTHAHQVATQRMLREIRRRAEVSAARRPMIAPDPRRSSRDV